MTQRGKITILGVVLLVLIVTTALVAALLLRETPQSVLNNSTNAVETNATTTNQTFVPQPTISQAEDADRDGLLDDEEKTLGTDANRSDTDADGLADKAEVVVYKTNPLSSDTDNDGVLDGAEVKSGQNPLGTGLLLDLQANITKTQE